MPLETLANVKASLLISGGDDDPLLTRLLDAAEDFIVAHTGRDFAGGTFTETHAAGRSLVVLRNFPVVTVVSLKVDATRQFGPETVRPVETFLVHAARGVIESPAGPFLPPRPGRRDDWPGAVQVVYTTPEGAVPPAIRQACVELVGHWYRIAKTAEGQDQQMLVLRADADGSQRQWSWGLTRGLPLPLGVLELLAPYRGPSV